MMVHDGHAEIDVSDNDGKFSSLDQNENVFNQLNMSPDLNQVDAFINNQEDDRDDSRNNHESMPL